MSDATVPEMSWAERAAERSPMVQRSRTRGVQQATAIVEAARRLIEVKGPSFTTQELVKEAGIALQTFYRYFPGKDHLLLAVIEDIVTEACDGYRQRAQRFQDPLQRLRFYVTAVVYAAQDQDQGRGPSFITAEHFRLQTLFPEEISRATRPYTDLVLDEITNATEAGLIEPADAEYSAWLIDQLVMAVYHHYNGAGLDKPADTVAERLWSFCQAALRPTRGPSARPAKGRRRTK